MAKGLSRETSQSIGLGIRPPVRLTNVTLLATQAGRHFVVWVDHHQSFSTLRLCGIDDEFAVGRKTGPLIARCVAQGLGFFTHEVHHIELELPALPRNIGQSVAIWAHCGGDVVVAREGHALGGTTVRGHAVNLGRAAPVTDKVNGAAVWGEGGLGVDATALRESVGLTA